MAATLIQTTEKEILARIRTAEVWGEMRHLFDLAESDRWFHDASWDKKSFGNVKGKKQIVFKTSYAGVMNIIAAKKSGKWVSSSVKIRTKDNDPMIQVDGKPHIYLMIGEQTVKFQGTGSSGGGSKMSSTNQTKAQELGSAWVFYQALSNAKHSQWKNYMDLYKDPDVKKVMIDVWKKYGGDYVEEGDQWAQNFFNQQDALIKKFDSMPGCCMFDQYTHSNEYTLPGMGGDSFMDWISARVGKMGVSGKDNWNPADIWLIQSSAEASARETIEKILDAPDTIDMKRDKVNTYMRALFQQHKIFGVSLKKVTKGPAKVVFYNHHEDFFTKNWKGEGAYGGKGTDAEIMSYDSAICKCGPDRKKGKVTLETQDMIFYVKDSANAKYKFQIKGNNSTDFSGLKYEPTAEGHSEARLGKATVELVIENLEKHKVGHLFEKNKTSYPYTADEFLNNRGSNQGQSWLQMIECLFNNKVDMGKARTAQEAYDNILACYDDENGSPHHANMKLQEIKWLCAFFAIKDDKKNGFATDMVWLAMKAGRNYGPYAKVY